MKSLLLSFALLTISFFAQAHPGHGHLSFSTGPVHAHLSWVQDPTKSSEGKMKIEWRSAANHALVEPPADFAAELFMPSMNHGSAPTNVQKMRDASGVATTGTYLVTDMYFIMDGDWEVRVSLLKPDGSAIETQAWPVTIGSGGHHH